MDIVEINKILTNPVRLEILFWLKEPEKHFPKHEEIGHFRDGVCGKYIQEKTKLSQSTISHFLNMMTKAKLLIATRYGKWTYFKRNDETIRYFYENLKNFL